MGRVNQEGQFTDYCRDHTSFSTSDLLNWKDSNPSYREDPQKMAQLITSIFATRDPNWTEVQTLFNILLTVDEKQLVIKKANEEIHHLHQENPNGTPNPAGAIPSTEPN